MLIVCVLLTHCHVRQDLRILDVLLAAYHIQRPYQISFCSEWPQSPQYTERHIQEKSSFLNEAVMCTLTCSFAHNMVGGTSLSRVLKFLKCSSQADKIVIDADVTCWLT